MSAALVIHCPCLAGSPDDADDDGVTNDRDNCSCVQNTLQENRDGDLYGDACDLRPSVFDHGEGQVRLRMESLDGDEVVIQAEVMDHEASAIVSLYLDSRFFDSRGTYRRGWEAEWAPVVSWSLSELDLRPGRHELRVIAEDREVRFREPNSSQSPPLFVVIE